MAAMRIDEAAPVRPGEELDSVALHAYLQAHFPKETGELRIEQFPSGFSNLTYLLRFGEQELVLRRPPFGAKIRTAHDMSREFKILSQLQKVFSKAPAPLLYCDDVSVLGAPFYLMERVQGAILRPKTPAESAPAPEQMAKIAGAFVECFAELHAVDYEAAGLADLGRPPGYVQRQIAGWTERYRHARTDDITEMEHIAKWLAGNQPPGAGTTLIHNDFKYDNLVLDPATPGRVKAVLDWEMATLGDPLMDLGTALGYWVDADDPPEMQQLQLSPTTLPGNPTRAEVAVLYLQKSGCETGHLVFYYAYGLFKIAVIIQQIYFRYMQGHTRDPRFANLIHAVRGCALVAWQAIQKGRIERLFAP